MQLRDGITAEQTIRALDQLVTHVENLRAILGAFAARDAYLAWVAQAERQLRSLFVDRDAAAELHTHRYALVRQLDARSPRPQELINCEIEAQAARLRELVEQLKSVMALANRPGVIAVPVTHVWLHYEQFDQIDWREIIAADKVRLVIPLRVLEELDEKTYARRADLRRRADKVLAALDPFLEKAADAPVEVRAGVTLEILLLNDSTGSDSSGQDGEILAASQFLQQAMGRAVTIVTGDRTMRLRARAYGLAVRQMPERLKKPLTSDTGEDPEHAGVSRQGQSSG